MGTAGDQLLCQRRSPENTGATLNPFIQHLCTKQPPRAKPAEKSRVGVGSFIRRDKPTLKRSAAWAGFRKSKVAWRGPGGPVTVGRCSHPWGRGRGDGAMPGAQGGRPYVGCLVGPGPLEKGPSTCATWPGESQESKGPQVSSGRFHWLNDPEARGRGAC